MNRTTLLGHLGTAPELRRTKNQTAVCRFRLATTERKRDSDGNWQEFAEWHNVVTFGKKAESSAQYLRKGRQVFVDGKLRTRTWTDSEGQARHITEIFALDIEFIGRRSQGMSESDDGPRDEAGNVQAQTGRNEYGTSLDGSASLDEGIAEVENDEIPW